MIQQSVLTTQLFRWSAKGATDNVKINRYGCVPIKLYLQKHAVGRFGSWVRVCWSLCLIPGLNSGFAKCAEVCSAHLFPFLCTLKEQRDTGLDCITPKICRIYKVNSSGIGSVLKADDRFVYSVYFFYHSTEVPDIPFMKVLCLKRFLRETQIKIELYYLEGITQSSSLTTVGVSGLWHSL